MTRARLFLTVAVAALLAAACGGGFDPDDPRLDGARLEIVGSPAVNLRYGESAALTVRYVDAEGAPIADAPIAYELDGDAAGSRLSALQTTTAGDGSAAVDLTAGTANAMFTVHVTPPRGDAVDFSVAVADTDLGSIVVSMTYAGSRELMRFNTFLFEGESCAGMDPRALPTALRSASAASVVTAMPAFAGVPVGTDYTVAVTAQGAAGVAAFGCRDGVAVRAREETPVSITLTDVELVPDFVGVWDLDNSFDFAEGLPPTVRNAIDIIDELTDDQPQKTCGGVAIGGGAVVCTSDAGCSGGTSCLPTSTFCGTAATIAPADRWYGIDPGAFIVDMLARQTCHWECEMGETYDTCSQNNHRLGDFRQYCLAGGFGSPTPSYLTQRRFALGCGAWDVAGEPAAEVINDQLNAFVPDFVFNWATFVGDLARAINAARIASILTINAPAAGNEFDLPMTHELISMTVVLHDPLNGGMERTFTFPLADAGLTSLETMDVTVVTGTTLNIPEHSFTLSFGRLVQYIYTNLFLGEILGYTSTAMMLMDYIDCAAIGTNLATSVGGLSASQYESACNSGINAAGTLLDTQIAGLIDADATFSISGTAVGADIDMSTARVGRLDMGMWAGFWGERDPSMTMMMSDLTGTFTGTRRAP
jgi:hypothetical protein